MDRVRRNVHLLSSFQNLNNNQQKAVQKHLDPDQVKFICELCENVLNENVPVDECLRKKLRPHKLKIRRLTNSKKGLKEKKSILQTGRFLPALLASLASPIIISAIEKYLVNDGKGEAQN